MICIAIVGAVTHRCDVTSYMDMLAHVAQFQLIDDDDHWQE